MAGFHFSRACPVCNSVSVRTTLAHATWPRPATTTAKAEKTSFARRTWPSFARTRPNYSANASRNWKQPFWTNSRSRACGRNAWIWCRIKSYATNASRIRTTPTTPERVSIGYRGPVVPSPTAFAPVYRRPCQKTPPPPPLQKLAALLSKRRRLLLKKRSIACPPSLSMPRIQEYTLYTTDVASTPRRPSWDKAWGCAFTPSPDRTIMCSAIPTPSTSLLRTKPCATWEKRNR